MNFPQRVRVIRRWLIGLVVLGAGLLPAAEVIEIPDAVWQSWSPRDPFAPSIRREPKVGH